MAPLAHSDFPSHSFNHSMSLPVMADGVRLRKLDSNLTFYMCDQDDEFSQEATLPSQEPKEKERRRRWTLVGRPSWRSITTAFILGCIITLSLLAIVRQLGKEGSLIPSPRRLTCPSCRKDNDLGVWLVPDYEKFNFVDKTAHAPTCEPLSDIDDVDFTLVTQLSLSRLDIMQEQCRRWGPNPMSLAVTSTIEEGDTHMDSDSLRARLREMGCETSQIALEIVNDFSRADAYPVNRLRNLAIANVQTSHFVMIDADFLVSMDLYDHLFEYHRAALVTSAKQALVIPAFELRSQCDVAEESCRVHNLAMAPENREDLLSMYDAAEDANENSQIVQFNLEGDFHSHGSTNYAAWVEQDSSTRIPISCITTDRYEPYLVLRHCQDLPPFQEAYVGYGQNKLIWMQHLRRVGWQFAQINQFLIHFPHTKSKAFAKWWNARDNQLIQPVERISASFRLWMAEHVPKDPSALPTCSTENSETAKASLN